MDDALHRRPAIPAITATAALLAGNLVLNLLASICFREGGTDAAHCLHYFIVGNVLGISSTILVMGLYKRMNVNMAMVLVTSGTMLLVQLTFWRLYHTPLTGLQVGGIALAMLGTVLASWTGTKGEPITATQEATPEVAG